MSSSTRRTRPLRHSRRVRRHNWLRAGSCVLVGALAFTGTGAWAMYNELQGNINSGYDLDDLRAQSQSQEPETAEPTTPQATPTPVDPKAGQAINILAIGSDDRTGENGDIGGYFEGARADTTLLVHISADRTRIDVVSIPRDLLADVPSCQYNDDGDMSRPQSAGTGDRGTRFNAAFATGGQSGDVGYGAVCAALTVEQMSGVTIDDFAVVDFVGFERMVDAIGGVPMTIAEPMNDDLANLHLEAGDQVLNGQQALALARARKSLGDGSDIGRIDRQQELLTAMVTQLLTKRNLLTDTPGLIQFLDAVTSSLTTSKGLGDLWTIAGLATSLSGVSTENINFSTIPFDYSGNVVVQNDDADEVWQRLIADLPVEDDVPVTTTTG